jgi:peptidoglycan/LPS O-acetylase OafA/YrhL
MSQSFRYRPEIDGLRAVAIVPVVLFHAGVPGFAGGFVGVDVFFVISGFLITRLLLDEVQAGGRIGFAAFYARRVRRLLPALATVVVAVLVAGIVILSAAIERPALSHAAMSTMAFVSNLYFWRSQAGYFAPPTDWMPLLNMWTLSVEEQFYLVWPAALALTAVAARRMRRPTPAALALVLGVAVAVSFALFVWGTRARPAAAYYLPVTRAWEFALGGLLVLAQARIEGARRFAVLLAPAGLALIVFAVVRWHGGPIRYAAVPAAFGAAAVIAGILALPKSRSARLLRLPPSVVIGKLSYSWYLWHWPLLAYGRVLDIGHDSLVRNLLLVVVALGLAALTFRFIEDPIRRRRPWPFAGARPTLAAGLVLSLSVVALAAALARQADAAMRRDPWLTAVDAAYRGQVSAPPGCALSQHFSGLAPAEDCLVGAAGAPARIVFWGDSHAGQFVETVRADGARGGYRAVAWSMSACRPVTAFTGRGPAFCQNFNRAMAAQIPVLAKAGVRGVVLASHGFGFPGRRGSAAMRKRWQDGMRAILTLARDNGMRVLVVAPIPQFRYSPPQCLAHVSAARCGGSRADYARRRAPLLAALRETVTGFDNARLWDPFDLLCGPRLCTAVRDGTIMYTDSDHLSVLGARALAPALAPALDWLVQRR